MEPTAFEPVTPTPETRPAGVIAPTGWRRPELHAVLGVLVVALFFLGLSARHHVVGKRVSASAPAGGETVPAGLGGVLGGAGAGGSGRSGASGRPIVKTPKVAAPHTGGNGGSVGGVPGSSPSANNQATPGVTLPGVTLPGVTVPGVTLPGVTVPGVGSLNVTCRDGGPSVTISAIGLGTVTLSIHNSQSSAITIDLAGLSLSSVLGVLHLTGLDLVSLLPGATQSLTVPLTGIPLNVIQGPLWAFTNGAPCP